MTIHLCQTCAIRDLHWYKASRNSQLQDQNYMNGPTNDSTLSIPCLTNAFAWLIAERWLQKTTWIECFIMLIMELPSSLGQVWDPNGSIWRVALHNKWLMKRKWINLMASLESDTCGLRKIDQYHPFVVTTHTPTRPALPLGLWLSHTEFKMPL